MLYNSNIHHRRSIRLKGYDYSQAGLYFITICVQDRKCLFGKIVNAFPDGAQMELNEWGSVAFQQWQKLPERFTNIELDVFQIMPNHMHGIIVLTDVVGAGFTPAPNTTKTPAQNNTNIPDHDDAIVNNDNPVADETWAGASPAPTGNSKSIGDIVGAYKSLVANECLKIFKQKYPGEMMGKLWQRNYYEHIIRDEQSYQRISDYIINNPVKWENDTFYKD
jgi:putative transposase